MSNVNDKYLYVMPNTTLPYGYELVNILGFPSGLESRFRFTEKWVSSSIVNNYKIFTTQKIIIVLRDIETARFYPVRYAKISKVEKIADTFYIKYIYGDLIEYDANQSLRNAQIEEFNKQFTAYHSGIFVDNVKSSDMKPLVFRSNFDFLFNNTGTKSGDLIEEELNKFQRILELLKEVSFYVGVEFFKIISIRNANTGGISEINKLSYNLVEDTDYVLSIYQCMTKKPDIKSEKPNDIEIGVDVKYISVINGKQRLVGPYDILNFTFRTNSDTSGVNTNITIFNHNIESNKYIEPYKSIPIKINATCSKLLLKIFFTIVVLFIYFFEQIINNSVNIKLSDVSKDISIVAFAMLMVEFKNMIVNYYKRN